MDLLFDLRYMAINALQMATDYSSPLFITNARKDFPRFLWTASKQALMRLSVSIDVWLKPKPLHLEKKIKRILIFIMHYISCQHGIPGNQISGANSTIKHRFSIF